MENRNSVDQRRQAVAAFFDAHRKLLARQGSLAATWRRRADARTGPYYLLVVRDAAGRRRSIYLGVAGPLVDEARAKLASIQAPKRERRVFDRAQHQLRAALRSARQELDLHLAPTGLWRKGSEIRGWRRAALRSQLLRSLTARIQQNPAPVQFQPPLHESVASDKPIGEWPAGIEQNPPTDLCFAASRHRVSSTIIPIRAASAAQPKSSNTNRGHLAESNFLAPAPLRPRGHPEKLQTSRSGLGLTRRDVALQTDVGARRRSLLKRPNEIVLATIDYGRMPPAGRDAATGGCRCRDLAASRSGLGLTIARHGLMSARRNRPSFVSK